MTEKRVGGVSILVVVAHPDDEVLGFGGAAARLSAGGASVTACILSGAVEARRHRPSLKELKVQMAEAQEILGMSQPIMGSFPNISFNVVPHLEVVQFIERAIDATEATVVMTHHPHDVNDDHRVTSFACQAAARVYQRRQAGLRLSGLYFMEILSSTDWSFEQSSTFVPNAFIEIGETALDLKLKALDAYDGVMRPYPHSRSSESVIALATSRGAQAGLQYAEAFQTAYCDLGQLAFTDAL